MRRPNAPRTWFTALLGLVTCVASLALSPAARADSVAEGTTLTRDKSISEWIQKSTKAGTFGAGYAVGYELEAVSGVSQYQRAYADFEAEMFSKRDVVAGAEAEAGTGMNSALTLTLLGTPIRSEDSASPTWSISVSADVDYLKVEYPVVVVVVPVTISAKLSGTNGIEVTLGQDSDYNTTDRSITVKPAIGTALTVEAAVGDDDFSAGIGGSVDLLQIAFPITLNLNYNPTQVRLTFGISGSATLTTLSGSFYLFANAYFVGYKKTLFDWEGYTLAETPIFSDSVPTAGGVTVDLSDAYRGEVRYQYSDNSGLAESGSTYKWEEALTSPGSTNHSVYRTWSGASYSELPLAFMSTSMSKEIYLRACVTPKNGINPGTETCSNWTAVGHIAQFYDNSGMSPGSDESALFIAYELSASGTCFNVPSYFNDKLSSYYFRGPTDYNSMLVFYRDVNCAGTELVPGEIGADRTIYDDNMNNTTLNNAMTSFRVVYEYDVGVADIAVDFVGDEARATYDFGSDANYTESGSTLVWERASDANGTGLATAATGSTSYALTTTDANKYLRFCVTPSDGYFTGDENCSDWTSVGPVAVFYKDANYGGTPSSVFAYQGDAWGTCTNVSTFWSNDAMSSLKFTAKAGSAATIVIYKDANCSGSAQYITAQAGATVSIASLSNTYGSSWNDSVSSIKVFH